MVQLPPSSLTIVSLRTDELWWVRKRDPMYNVEQLICIGDIKPNEHDQNRAKGEARP